MKQLFNNDHDILEALRSKVPANVSAALKHLFQNDKLKAAVRQQLYLQKGDEHDTREMLNQALVVFLNQVEDGKYDPALSGITTYIVKIAAQLYYTKRRSEMRRMAMHDRSVVASVVEIATNPELEMNFQHTQKLLEEAIALTGEKCRQALKLYSFSFSMAEISEKLSYKSADVAKMAIQDCRKKLQKILTERPDLLAELREL